MNYEQEEEFLTNDLSRKLMQVITQPASDFSLRTVLQLNQTFAKSLDVQTNSPCFDDKICVGNIKENLSFDRRG